MTDSQNDLIQYRRQRALETLRDAEILFDADRLFSAVNRIYYAVFYQVTALLLTSNLNSSKHSGLRALFNEHFVKTNKVSVLSGKFYAQMFDYRQKSDYGDYAEFDKTRVGEWLLQAGRFLQELDRVMGF